MPTWSSLAAGTLTPSASPASRPRLARRRDATVQFHTRITHGGILKRLNVEFSVSLQTCCSQFKKPPRCFKTDIKLSIFQDDCHTWSNHVIHLPYSNPWFINGIVRPHSAPTPLTVHVKIPPPRRTLPKVYPKVYSSLCWQNFHLKLCFFDLSCFYSWEKAIEVSVAPICITRPWLSRTPAHRMYCWMAPSWFPLLYR